MSMLFSDPISQKQQTHTAMMRSHKYLPFDKTAPPSSYADPEMIRRVGCFNLLTDYTGLFDIFLEAESVVEAARTCGLKIKDKHTIVQPWPFRVGMRTTKKEFDILAAAGTDGFEQYMEVEKLA